MSRPIVPIQSLQRRLPEAGRLRIGVRSGRAMKAIDTWRFTSHDEEAINQVARIYGGEPRPWKDAPTPGQHEVITTAAELHVVLPPEPLGGGPYYEMWSGGGCQRRCDGITCTVTTTGPDGGELAEVECICQAKSALECVPKTRLSVLLPDVKFAGVWRLETSSWNVAHELPPMIELIRSLQERGLTRALLALEHRRSVSGGQTRRFVVPVLRVADSLDAIAAGAARVGAVEAPHGDPTPALSPAPEPEEDVADGEVMVDDGAASALSERLAALPTRLRNRAERLRHQAGLPTLEEPLSADEVERWAAVLQSVEQIVAPEDGQLVDVEHPPDVPVKEMDLTPVAYDPNDPGRPF